jgi:undecaprenyl-phosphate galactose phosphotransferase
MRSVKTRASRRENEKEILHYLRNFHFQIKHDVAKRAFDIVFSSVFLLAASPFFFLLAILVKGSSKGPIFYKSPRLGRGGKAIQCLKFRTMFVDAESRLCDLLQTKASLRAEWETFQKLKEDPRITPIGKFLRKTSLDEIPQFWNVLVGDLSVVGPRPPTLLGPPEYYLQEIRKLYGPAANLILSVRPGITGLWQISGRSQIPMQERAKMEAQYATSRNFWSDLVVIAKTIPAVFFSKGAF